ncbi:MAG: hypothetical protein P8Y65_02515 [Campylobacterales bacterium]
MAKTIFRPAFFMSARLRSQPAIASVSSVGLLAFMVKSVVLTSSVCGLPAVIDLPSFAFSTVSPMTRTDIESDQKNHEQQ